MTTLAHTPSTDIAADEVALLLPTLQGPVMTALTRGGADVVADAMAAAATLLITVGAGPEGMTGAGLDRSSEIIGEPRNGRAEPKYAGATATQLLIQRSNGIVDQLRAIFRGLTGPGGPVIGTMTPGAIILEAHRATPIPLAFMQQQAVSAHFESAASVHIDPIVAVMPSSFTLTVWGR